MDSSSVPAKIQLPFANAGTKNTIPVTPGADPSLASFQQGFPPLNFTPLAIGGVPPHGADMNGALNAITAIQQWQCAGGLFKYDATLSTAIGGYPAGAQLLSSDNTKIWLCEVDGNTANPDVGGAGWHAMPNPALTQQASFISCNAAGTSDTITGSFTPAIAALPGAGNTLFVLVRALAANATTTPTFKANGTAAKTIVKFNNQPLVIGDIPGAGAWIILQYDPSFDKWVLQNPGQGTLFTQAGVGAVPIDQQKELRFYTNVKQFGATGDGTTDDTIAIQNAINSKQKVFFPAGQYRITSPINWTNQMLFGEVDNGTLSLAANQTMILCDGTFPAFRYYHPSGFNSQGGGIRNFNILFADGLRPASAATRPNAVGIKIDDTSGPGGYPAQHVFENITVRGGMWAIYDKSGSWQAQYSHIHSHECFAHIYKENGTTHVLNNCHNRSGFSAYAFKNVLGVTLNGCSADLTETVQSGYVPVLVDGSTVIVNGGDFEANSTVGSQKSTISVTGAGASLQFNGTRFLNPQFTATDEIYFLKADAGAKASLRGCDLSTAAYVGSGGLFTYFVAVNGASIEVDQSVAPSPTGGVPATTFVGVATTGSISYSNVTTTLSWSGNSRKKESSLRFSTTVDLPSISANSFYTATYSVPGAVIGDFAGASLATAINGLIANAWVNAADSVAINYYNLTGSAIDLPNTTLRIKVTQQ